MRTTLDLPDALFARLRARAVSQRMTLKQLLRSYVEQGLSTVPDVAPRGRSAAELLRLDAPLSLGPEHCSNAGLFELLDP